VQKQFFAVFSWSCKRTYDLLSREDRIVSSVFSCCCWLPPVVLSPMSVVPWTSATGTCLSVVAACAVSLCVCVCHVRALCRNEFQIFSPSGSHTILVFQHQTGWQYFDGSPPNGGVECRLGRQKSRFWAYLALPAVSAATCQVLSTRSLVDDGQRTASCDTSLVVSGGADCGRRRWSLDVTPKTTEQRI